MIAAWPQCDPARQDARIEARFARFQDVLRAVRDIRSRQNIAPKQQIEFTVRCDAEVADLLRPMEPYFDSMAGARLTGIGPDVQTPALSANVALPGIDVFVDLAELVDLEAELARKRQELEKLETLVAAKKKKLENESFISRAPEAVVQKERDSLAELEAQRATTSQVLTTFATLFIHTPKPSRPGRDPAAE